jgi:hypothetical protein
MSRAHRSGPARPPSTRSFLMLCAALVLAALLGMALAGIAHAAGSTWRGSISLTPP